MAICRPYLTVGAYNKQQSGNGQILKKEKKDMKDYKTPIMEIYFLNGCDIVTLSDSNDNNFEDSEDWG